MLKKLKEKLKNNKILNIISNSLNIAFNILTLSIVLIVLIMAFNKIRNPNVTPSLFGYKVYFIKSGSMYPTINVKDIIIVKNVEEKNIKIGDIISFRIKNNVITHRVYEIKNNSEKIYITKGDFNNTIDDEELTYNQIEGKLCKIIPKKWNILNYLNFKTLIIIIVLIVIFNILSEIFIKKNE